MSSSLLWATASGGRVLTEDGALVATFTDEAVAAEIVDAHNFEVELDADDTPEVRKTREQEIAARVDAWKREDPDGARPLRVLSESVARMARLLSLKAPPIILGENARRIADLGASLAALFPDTID
jgi:hypothetical protein